MESWERICRSWASAQQTRLPREAHRQETVRRAKLAFEASRDRRPMSRLEFLIQQSHTLWKGWWLLQGAVLLVLWRLLGADAGNWYTQRVMGILAPLFVVLVLPELGKNRAWGALEVECSTYYSLRQLYAARLLLFGLADLLLLTVFFSAALRSGRATPEELILNFLIPFLGTACLCFRTLCSPRPWAGRAALPLTMVWVVVWEQLVLSDRIYPLLVRPVWLLLLFLALVYLGACVLRLQKNCESIWEADPSWN